MVQCDKCLVWQHTECVGFTERLEEYHCERCSPAKHPYIQMGFRTWVYIPLTHLQAFQFRTSFHFLNYLCYQLNYTLDKTATSSFSRVQAIRNPKPNMLPITQKTTRARNDAQTIVQKSLKKLRLTRPVSTFHSDVQAIHLKPHTQSPHIPKRQTPQVLLINRNVSHH